MKTTFLSMMLGSLLLCTWTLSPSRAATLLAYTFDADTVSPTTVATNLSGTSLTFNLPTGFEDPSGLGPTPPSRYMRETFPDNATTTSYLEFSITPAAGYALDLSSIEFIMAYNADNTTGAISVRSGITGYDAADEIGIFSTPSTGYTANEFLTPPPFSLAGPEFQGLTGTTVFRLYLSDTSGVTREIRIDNLILSGEVIAVPEPAAGGLLLLGGLGLLAHRRKLLF